MGEMDDGTSALEERLLAGEDGALAELFEHFRRRLEVLVRLRIDPRVLGRFDVGDVLQEAFLRASQALSGYRAERPLPVFLWLRAVTIQTLWRLHRHHLGTEKRDAGRGVSLDWGGPAQATSVALAARLVGDWTSPSQHAMRVEARTALIAALEELEPLDRDILVLRHLEELSNREAALELGIPEETARKRHWRAFERLRRTLEEGLGA